MLTTPWASLASCRLCWGPAAESRGALWLAAAAGVGIGIPFNLLLMSPPVAVLTGGLEPPSQ